MTRVRAALVAALVALPLAVSASDVDQEVAHLIEAVETSGCEFVRNGKTHDAGEAAAHLRMKYRRGKKYANTAEAFISRLASRSSISRKPYRLKCPGEAPQLTGEWLTRQLEAYREG